MENSPATPPLPVVRLDLRQNIPEAGANRGVSLVASGRFALLGAVSVAGSLFYRGALIGIVKNEGLENEVLIWVGGVSAVIGMTALTLKLLLGQGVQQAWCSRYTPLCVFLSGGIVMAAYKIEQQPTLKIIGPVARALVNVPASLGLLKNVGLILRDVRQKRGLEFFSRIVVGGIMFMPLCSGLATATSNTTIELSGSDAMAIKVATFVLGFLSSSVFSVFASHRIIEDVLSCYLFLRNNKIIDTVKELGLLAIPLFISTCISIVYGKLARDSFYFADPDGRSHITDPFLMRQATLIIVTAVMTIFFTSPVRSLFADLFCFFRNTVCTSTRLNEEQQEIVVAQGPDRVSENAFGFFGGREESRKAALIPDGPAQAALGTSMHSGSEAVVIPIGSTHG